MPNYLPKLNCLDLFNDKKIENFNFITEFKNLKLLTTHQFKLKKEVEDFLLEKCKNLKILEN